MLQNYIHFSVVMEIFTVVFYDLLYFCDIYYDIACFFFLSYFNQYFSLSLT